MKYLSFNIDNINAGKILFDFYEKTGDGRYKVAMDTLRKQLAEQPRTSEGGFWHKLVYPHQMWLDGIFMLLLIWLNMVTYSRILRSMPIL